MKEMSNTLPGHKCMKVVGGHVIRWFLSGFSVLGKTKMDSKYLSIPRIIKYNIVGVSNLNMHFIMQYSFNSYNWTCFYYATKWS